MLCTNCGLHKVTTGEGLCDACATAAAYAATPTPVTVTEPPAVLRSPVGLSYAVMALLGVVIAVDAFSVFASLRARSQWAEWEEGFSAVELETLEQAESLMGISVQLYVYALLVTGIVFIIWFRRVRRNAGIFAPDVPRRGPGWAIGAWFIPVANLWIPRGIAADIWTASRRDPYGPDGRREQPLIVVNVWWTLYVASWFFARFARWSYEEAEAAAQIREALVLYVVTDLLDIAAAALAIVFVRTLTRMQHHKAMTPGGFN